MKDSKKRYILTLSCPDIAGIVAAVSTFLANNGGFIIESAQFGDPFSNRFFMRTYFEAGEKKLSLEKKFETIAKQFKMDWQIGDISVKPRVLLMVSKQGHCLNDILHRYSTGNLQIEIPAVVSNHPDLKKMVDWYEIPFFHLPVHEKTKAKQEEQILRKIEDLNIDLVVLARYMQILSPKLSRALKGRAINIHHSFLPSFKGAKPYHQAYERGVKIIGATAHYITNELDEGPIIEQEVIRVNHTHKPDDLKELGQDIENQVLARAIKFHTERRVLLNGNKTVIFR